MQGASSSSSTFYNVSLRPTGPQVFINFRGKDLRKSFISFLVPALEDNNINVFIDEREERGKGLVSLFERIGESKIAVVIFSEGYMESKWCLDELVQIKECMVQNKLKVIPIFYKLDPITVKCLKGNFGDKLRELGHRYQHQPEKFQKWTEALSSVSQRFAMSLPESSDKSDKDFIKSIVEEVKKVLPKERNEQIVNSGILVPAMNMTTHVTPNEEVYKVFMIENVQKMMISAPETTYEVKIWADVRPMGKAFMINARQLSIEWSENPDHWTWHPLRNQLPNELVLEAAFLKKASWLDVTGKLNVRYLSPSTWYEVIFVVLLRQSTFKWKRPVKLKLEHVSPSNTRLLQERSVNMVDYICNQWVDMPIGEFTTSTNNFGEIHFAMYEHECQLWKSGLLIKGVVIRPKH